MCNIKIVVGIQNSFVLKFTVSHFVILRWLLAIKTYLLFYLRCCCVLLYCNSLGLTLDLMF